MAMNDSEVYVTLHYTPAGAEARVRELLSEYEEFDGQWSNYEAFASDADELKRELADLGCAFELSHRGEYDYTSRFVPELGFDESEDGDEGESVLCFATVESLLELTTVEEIHAKIRALTGNAWTERFKAYRGEES